MKLNNYKIWQLREMGEKNRQTLERLCCENNCNISCKMYIEGNKSRCVPDITHMIETLVSIKKEIMHASGKLHIPACDEYHAHYAPECCSYSCWCKEEYEKPK